MYCDANFYLCRNLVYLQEERFRGYVCTVTGLECKCGSGTAECPIFEEEAEE